MFRITVVGDGAVGTAVAVALSRRYSVVIAGPPDSGTETKRYSITGVVDQSADLLHLPIDRVTGSSLVITALKSFHIAGAVPFIQRFSEGSPICLSNGMGLDNEWGPGVPEVEYAVLTAGFSKPSSPDSTAVTPGEIFCSPHGRCEELFRNTFLPVRPVDCIQDVRWAKWYANSIVNPIGALTGLPNNLLESSDLGYLIPVLEMELENHAPSEKALQKGRQMLRWILKHSSNRCSMLQDIDAGRRTEINHLTGKASQYSPAAEMLTALVKART